MINYKEYNIFIKRIGLVGVAQIILSLRGLIILPILTKSLGASGYGILTQILITVSLLQPFVQLGLGTSTVRFLSSKKKEEIAQGIFTCLSITLLTGLITSLVLLLSANYLASILINNESAIFIIKLSSPLIILEALNAITLGSFRIFGKLKYYFVSILLQAILEIGLVAFFVLSGYGLFGAVVSFLIGRAITLALNLYFIYSCVGFASPDFSLLRPFLIYGVPLIPGSILDFVVSLSDRYVIGFFMGAKYVGIYSAAYGLGNIISLFLTVTAYILAPTVFNLYDKGKFDEVKNYLSYSWKYLLMLSIPSAFGLSILAKPLLNSLTTPEFISTGKFIVPLVSFSMVLYGMYVIFGEVIQFLKQTKIFALAIGIAGVINIGLNFLFIPLWGVNGAAITTFIAYAIMALIIFYKSRQYMKFNLHLGFLVKSILASIVMSSAIWAFDPIGAVEIISSVIIGAAIYFAVLLLLNGFKKAETQFFIQLFKKTVGEIRNTQ